MTYSQPLVLVFSLIALVGALRKRRWLAVAGVAGLFVIISPAAEWLFSRPLEAGYDVRPFKAPVGIQAIVVFSGGVRPPVFERPYSEPDEDTVERCEYAAWIYRNCSLPVLACGGSGPHKHPPYSAVMRDLLRRGGVPDEMIWTEEKSQNTHENALYGAEILRRHGIGRVALVVDARSMP
ncbi:MAG TPA: YdcF family protein, partial [Candidatus Acidoferrales bacterium]|nr:YdcF family protein [Candidatus Acidoferrales bacterium]